MFEKTKIDEVREAARKWEEEKVPKSVASFP